MEILSWKNKYGTKHYDASTPERLERAARAVLKELIDDGWMYAPDPPALSEEKQEMVGLTEEQVEALPPALRTGARLVRDAVAQAMEAYEEEAAEYDLAVRLARGESVMEARWTRSGQPDAEWAAICEDARTRWPHAELREDGVYLPATAWSILQSRDGYEYEFYSLSRVITFED